MSTGLAQGTPEIKSCSPDLVSNVPDDILWDNAYIIRGDDDTAWQRAIFNQRTDVVTIREGETFTIEGTAQPGAPVQVFIYTRSQEPGASNRPNNGVCFQLDETDPSSGYFSMELHARLLWPNIGRNIVLDAFSRLENSWDQLENARTNQNYHIGTHILPTTVSVELEQSSFEDIEELSRQRAGVSGSCNTICNNTNGEPNLLEAVLIDPANAPFPIIEQSFNAIGSQALQLARIEGTNTVYLNSELINDRQSVADITMNAVTIEVLKQTLLGLRNDTVSMPIDGISTISAAELQAAASGSGAANLGASQMALNLKKMLTNAPDRNEAAEDIARVLMNNDNLFRNAAQALLSALPTAGTEENWAQNFADTVTFWTGDLEPNVCLSLCDGTSFSDQLVSGNRGGNYTCNGVAQTDTDTAPGNRRIRVLNFEFVIGDDPRLVLNSEEEVNLEPDFKDIMITYASKLFDSGQQGWTIPAHFNGSFYYQYAFLKPYAGAYVGEACIAKSDVEGYARDVSTKFGLNTTEERALVAELFSSITDDEGYYKLSVADPASIAERFRWKNGGIPLDIFQLFFAIDKNDCDATDFGSIEATKSGADGFEAGILID